MNNLKFTDVGCGNMHHWAHVQCTSSTQQTFIEKFLKIPF